MTWGDFDGDDDLDLAAGNADDVNVIYEHEGGVALGLASTSLIRGFAGSKKGHTPLYGPFHKGGEKRICLYSNPFCTFWLDAPPTLWLRKGGTSAKAASGKTNIGASYRCRNPN